MKDVAVYQEKSGKGTLSNVITVFSFSPEAHDAVRAAITSGKLNTIKVSVGNKPDSLRTKIQTTKEIFNKLLGA